MGRQVATAGYARLAEGTPSRHVYEYLTLSVIVEVETNTIVKADASLVSQLGVAWVQEQLVGVDLFEDPPSFVATVERDYWGLSGPALVQAYRDLVRRYRGRLEAESKAA